MEDNSDKKQNTGHLFYHKESIFKFQNISIHGSKLMLCTWKQQMAKTAKGYNYNNISFNWLKI